MFATPLAQFSELVVNHYLDLATTPAGIAAITGFVLAAALTLVFPGLRWVHLTLGLYVATYAIARIYEGGPLTPPFAWIGPVGQPATAGFLLLMLVATVRPPPVRRKRLCIGLFVALLTFQAVIAARTAYAGFTIRAGGSMAVWLMMFLVFAVGMSYWLYDRTQLSRLIRAVAWAAGIMAVGNILQGVISPAAVFGNGRLFGTTPNPQRLAIFLATTLPFCAYAALEARGGWRMVYGSIAGVSLVMIAATGSRTGMLMAAMSMLVFFRTEVGRAMLFASAGMLAMLIGYLVIGDAIGFGLSRFQEGGNTRIEVWEGMFNTFLSSPLAGVGMDSTPGESTYLSVAAACGVLGLVPTLVVVGMMLRTSVKLLRARRSLGADYDRAADLVAAVFVPAVVVCFTFEATLIGILTDFMLLLYTTMAIAGVLLEQVAERKGAGALAIGPAETAEFPGTWPGGLQAGRYAGEVG